MSRLDRECFHHAARCLRTGGLVAFPTETVYGLGADATNEAAIARLFRVKGRPRQHPLIVHLASSAQLSDFARRVPTAAKKLAEAFWPGPLTIILPRGKCLPLAVTGGQDTVGLRVPNHPVALALLTEFGGPIAAPSANRFGAVSPTTADHVRADLGTDVDLVLDGGLCQVGVESTIIDLSGDEPALLRPGGVSADAVEAVLGRRLIRPEKTTVRAPGQLPSHYAPRARVVLVEPKDLALRVTSLVTRGFQVGVIAPAELSVPDAHARLVSPPEPDAYARSLYASLRELDRREVEMILVVAPAANGVGLAVIDRLQRAAAPRPPSPGSLQPSLATDPSLAMDQEKQWLVQSAQVLR